MDPGVAGGTPGGCSHWKTPKEKKWFKCYQFPSITNFYLTGHPLKPAEAFFLTKAVLEDATKKTRNRGAKCILWKGKLEAKQGPEPVKPL